MSGGVSRSFYWDAPATAPSTPAPYAIGKIVDAIDTGNSQVHHDYSSNGLLSRKTWSFPLSKPKTPVGSLQLAYDDQGRIQVLTYPTPFATPISIRYDYDSYNGTESAITDVTNAASPTSFWSVSARNELGQSQSESMGISGGATLTRSADYYLQNGMTKSASLSGSNGQSQLTYGYDAGGLPSTLSMSGVGGVWSSTFGHDNLGRLTQWQPTSGTTVNFSYDSDGNLTQRAWSGETVNYGKTSTARTVAVVQGGVTVKNDAYQFDSWGRVIDTPAVTLTYDALDETTSVTEKGNGQVDGFSRDAFGNRILTQVSPPPSLKPLSSLYTLDDLYEFRSSSSAGSEERCRVRAGGRLIGELVRTSATSPTAATFYLTDNVGSVVAEASQSGVVTARTRRDPFGNVTANASAPYLPADPTAADPDGSGRMGFGDHALDRNLGVVDMVSRFYSPRLGRFISPDQILPDAFDRTQHNAFAYVGNAPDALRDPMGFCGEPEGEPCPQPPIGPGGTPQPPPKGDGQDPYNHCANGECSCGDHDCPPSKSTKPVSTDVKRLGGGPSAGATSANAKKTPAIPRSVGATGGGEGDDRGTERITYENRSTINPAFCLIPGSGFGCRVGVAVINGLGSIVDRLYTKSGAASPAFNPDRASRRQAGQQFGEEAFRDGLGVIGASASLTAARGASAAGKGYRVGKFTFTETVANHLAEIVKKGRFKGELARPFQNSDGTQLLIEQIMGARKGVPDPGGIPGALRWDVPGRFRGTEGTWQLVAKDDVIFHFNFEGD